MTHKTTKAIYWTSTAIIVLFDGLVPALTSNTQLAIDGIRHLGYPDYFRVMLTVFKVLGATTLILPVAHKRIKEWAYAGFAFNLISAFASHWAVDGLSGQTLFPLFTLVILATSYVFFYRLRKLPKTNKAAFTTNRYLVSGLSQ